MHKDLEWARKRGLNCEMELMAAILRELKVVSALLALMLGTTFGIGLWVMAS